MLVEPGKAARPVEMKNDLHEMQQMVGGPIQALYPWEEPVAIVCNDEGKNMGLPLLRQPLSHPISFSLCAHTAEEEAEIHGRCECRQLPAPRQTSPHDPDS